MNTHGVIGRVNEEQAGIADCGPSEPSHQRLIRRQFRNWLTRRRKVASEKTLAELIEEFEGPISTAAAYRVALAMGLRGQRRNATRYDAFWESINWRLPDSTLAAIWGVTRGNLRQRRLRMNQAAAAYSVRMHRRDNRFQAEVTREKNRAADYSGPRPR